MSTNLINRRLYATGHYSRNIGMLRKEDYLFIRENLEKHLENMQLSNSDFAREIDELKVFFIKLDHAISRL
ncbi:hypothetical protein D7V32_16480 [Acinetobacter tianfuensis]|uniref:Uncharacterized protein n=1 Tax=Acinetobacter tianfuensis TaxID=2419603 RepID=A0A3A8E4N5_9GAMM|nr:hypothetical protein D7V32_16480 [Acinetobacter tianfuensis]